MTTMDPLRETPEPKVDELPSVVWLRGDEPYFSEFSLNADQVMSTLGIKRSRLNQLSGREIRVGKARIDRYLRPVYRPQDIEAYLNTARASMSHQRSSKILNEASEALREKSSQLEKRWEQDLSDLQDQLKSWLHKEYSSLLSRNRPTKIEERFAGQIKEQLKQIREMQNRQTQQSFILAQQLCDMDKQLATLALLTELNASVRASQQINSNLHPKIEDLQESFETLTSSFEEIKQQNQAISDTLSQLSHQQSVHSKHLDTLSKSQKPAIIKSSQVQEPKLRFKKTEGNPHKSPAPHYSLRAKLLNLASN